MSYTRELIDRVKTELNIESDYALAEELGVTRAAISSYRRALSHADDRVAVLLADKLRLDRFKTIARINAERAKKPEERAFWRRLANAAVICLAVYTSFGATPSKASDDLTYAEQSRHCALFRSLARNLMGSPGRRIEREPACDCHEPRTRW